MAGDEGKVLDQLMMECRFEEWLADGMRVDDIIETLAGVVADRLELGRLDEGKGARTLLAVLPAFGVSDEEVTVAEYLAAADAIGRKAGRVVGRQAVRGLVAQEQESGNG